MSIQFDPFAVRGSRTACPKCGRVGTMTLSECFEVNKDLSWSLAGAQVKVPATLAVRITCGDDDVEGCGWNALGDYDDGYFVVRPILNGENDG